MTTAAEFDKKYDIVDEKTPPYMYMTGHYKQSFAYTTLRQRLPITLTTIVDNLTKDKEEIVEKYGEKSREEIKTVVGKISKLKYELQTDKALECFTGNEFDKDVWNQFIKNLPPENRTFFKTCWLYAECYMYRRVSSFFEATETLQKFDYFEKQKVNALVVCREAMEAVAACTRCVEKSPDMFRRLLKLNLWGNRCDLSMTSGQEVRIGGNPFDLVMAFEKHLVIDQTLPIWWCLNEAKTDYIVVEYICDNAGYELFTDFVLAEYMINHGLAHKVRFNVKAIPWFISDVTPNDFSYTLQYLSEHESKILREIGSKWSQYLKEGKFELAPIDYFWTSPYEFYRMINLDSSLYMRLNKAQLVIFKGDLNYRKLIGDYTWNFTDRFEMCLRGFQPTNLCTLRTVKADLICGLPEGVAENLFKMNKDWMITGNYGVVQFAKDPGCDR